MQRKVTRLVGFLLRVQASALCVTSFCVRARACWWRSVIHLVPNERRDDDLVEEAQHDDEKCDEAHVFVPSLKFPAILEQWGDGGGREEGGEGIKLREEVGHV